MVHRGHHLESCSRTAYRKSRVDQRLHALDTHTGVHNACNKVAWSLAQSPMRLSRIKSVSCGTNGANANTITGQ